MDISIIKFGGTALATPSEQLKVLSIIKKYKGKIIIICSAMGRDGFSYSTNELEKLINIEKVSLKERDRLLSCGEIISSIRLSSLLNENGIKTYSLSNREINIMCDNNYGDGRVLSNLDIHKWLEIYDVIIVPGFVGISEEQEIITLGRGNSDYSAVLVADKFNIKEISLYKDVDGVSHTPPKLNTKMIWFDYISYDEMLALEKIGINIVSKKALIFAKEKNIKIYIKNYNTDIIGTIISSEISKEAIIGFNIIGKIIKVATFYPNIIKDILFNELNKVHIFAQNIKVGNNYFSFEVSKSILNNVRKLLIEQIELRNRYLYKKINKL